MSQNIRELAIKARTTAFGSYIDPERELIDLPNMVLVAVDAPEYARNGLGPMIAKTLRYHFVDTGQHGCEAVSIGADSSGGHVIYKDMNPVVLGSLSDVTDRQPAIAKLLFGRHYGPEMVALGCVLCERHDIDGGSPDGLTRLVALLNKYHRRASWMEAHKYEVTMANMEAMVGNGSAFDWMRLYPGVETGEV